MVHQLYSRLQIIRCPLSLRWVRGMYGPCSWILSQPRKTRIPSTCTYKIVLMLILLYVYGCFTYMHIWVSHVCLVPDEGRRGHQIAWIEVTAGCELPMCAGPLERQQVFLSTESSLQPHTWTQKIYIYWLYVYLWFICVYVWVCLLLVCMCLWCVSVYVSMVCVCVCAWMCMYTCAYALLSGFHMSAVAYMKLPSFLHIIGAPKTHSSMV